MPSHERLLAIAYQRERVASRRLAISDGLSAEQALRDTLTGVAGASAKSLAALVQMREQAALQAQAALTLKRERKAAAHAAKAAGLQADPAAWRAWFDGSSHPNPGRLGIGGVLCSPSGVSLEICRMAGHGDSNEAEFLALIAILEAALAAGAGELVAYGDSRVVIDAVSAKTPPDTVAHLSGHLAHARALAAQIANFSLRWIPRHKNGVADALSQRAIALSGSDPALQAPVSPWMAPGDA